MTGAATRPFLVIAFLFAAASSAQTPEFEVAAIKPAAPQAVHVGTTRSMLSSPARTVQS
jgi:hypothetical protein